MRGAMGMALLLLAGCTGKNANDTCWWCNPTGTIDVSTEEYGDGDFEEDDPGQEWFGELDPTTGLGTYGFWFVDPAVGSCELGYPVTSAVAATDCGSCEFAWEMTLGTVEVWEDGGGCAAGMGLDGTVIRAGHGSDTLFMHDGQSWASLGWSEIDGSDWNFGTEE